ncbi:hypothetical protein CLUG_02792 [Clavispora lusitaniae ATCC 42720]|uniref:Uncharacterized protein n=1 Tax=Clavispora lusitaniae (strain ATCC 42720) TaxID=306902 RepID=C4Y2M9_CLAL4|nr:uncharacterized protein CLUG_02792 [Clavispora lusitaniae ATCC 42720]EEQ38666.1 hypothetical protein CLUG_02792 [Clavispora lusitaniae ATCC 42720]
MKRFHIPANLKDLLPLNGKESAFSLGQLSMVFLVDLLRSNSEIIMEHLPLLLHVSFSLLDHYFTLVQEQAVSLLIHLVHLITPGNPKSARISDLLKQKDHQKNLWVYDYLNNDKNGGMTPEEHGFIVALYFASDCSLRSLNLQTDWSRVLFEVSNNVCCSPYCMSFLPGIPVAFILLRSEYAQRHVASSFEYDCRRSG